MKISPIIGYNYSTKQTKTKSNGTDTLSVSYNTSQISKKPSFGLYLIDDMFYYFRGKANGERAESRNDQIQQIWTKVTSDVAMVSDRLGIPFSDAKEMYDKYLELGGLKANRNGDETGLNKVVGYSLEKLDLIKEVVSPIVLLLKNSYKKDEVEKYKEAVPSGILLFGPGGLGRNFLTECFYEHLQAIANKKDINLVTVEMNKEIDPANEDELIEYIRNTFENAECWDGEKHTVIFIKNLEKYIDNASEDVLAELAFQMTGARDKGITWLATTEKGADLPDWVFNPSRLGVAKSIREMENNEMSAVMSYFWAKLGRFDKSNHEEILNFCKSNAITLAPPMFAIIAENVGDRLSDFDKKYAGEPDYVAPVTTEEVIAAIREYNVKRNSDSNNEKQQRNKYTGPEEERLVGMKIGKYLAIMEK